MKAEIKELQKPKVDAYHTNTNSGKKGDSLVRNLSDTPNYKNKKSLKARLKNHIEKDLPWSSVQFSTDDIQMLAYRDLQQSKLKHLKIQKKFMIMEHQYQNYGNIFNVDLNQLKEQSKKLDHDIMNLQEKQKECEN